MCKSGKARGHPGIRLLTEMLDMIWFNCKTSGDECYHLASQISRDYVEERADAWEESLRPDSNLTSKPCMSNASMLELPDHICIGHLPQ